MWKRLPRDVGLVLALLGLVFTTWYTTACSSDGDGDGDADGDSDSDTDTDGDADADSTIPCEGDDEESCDDHLACTGRCEWQGEFGCVRVEDPPDCDDGVLCSLDSCLEPSGECENRHVDENCDDDNECTSDICGDEGCENPNVDDETLCTDGVCYSGYCCGNCWDGENCREGNTLDQCGSGGALCEDCDDGNECTDDACVDRACVHTPLGPETECEGGVCRSGECCTGCWVESTSSCIEATDRDHCGTGGEICGTCPCDSDTCADGICSPADLQVASAVAGDASTFAVTATGRLYAWGDNNRQYVLGLGLGSADPVLLPARVGDGGDWVSVDEASSHGCGIQEVGGARTLWCWGSSDNGRLGLGTPLTDVNVPTMVGAGTNWVQVTVGDSHTCSVTTGGTLHCWGNNRHGQGGTCRDVTEYSEPTQVTGESGDLTSGWVQVDAGGSHTCAIHQSGDDRQLFCWGLGADGQRGDGRTTPIDETCPRQEITGATDWAMVSAGRQHTCGIREEEPGRRTLWCWGNAGSGRVGDGTSSGSRSTPVQIGTDADWEMVSAGATHTCAIRTDGRLFCWGANGPPCRLGLGDDDTAERTSPTRVGEHSDWTFVTAGGDHTCGIRRDLRLNCWGRNNRGQLGQDHTDNWCVPIHVCLE